MSNPKFPPTQHELHPLIRKRWSPISFNDQPIKRTQMEELLEAASWAASAFNEQPWQYVYAFRGSPGFMKLWNCLAPGNQPWTKNAAILFVACKKNTFARNGKVNNWAAHDLGMANAQLLLQAIHRDIYGHLMAGFDAEKTTALLELDELVTPVCMGALGYLGKVEDLPESMQAREKGERQRAAVATFAQELE